MPADTALLRDALFSDCPLKNWDETQGQGKGEPWSTFRNVKVGFDAGVRRRGVSLLRKLLELKTLESRAILQAWTFLRELGDVPPDVSAENVLGVVVEVALPDGLDLLAGYADGSARYYNFSGAGVVWEHPDTSLDGVIKELLDAGQAVVNRTGPWEGPRPAPPPEGSARLNMLTAGGLFYGQGPVAMIAADELSGPVLQAGLRLMKALVEKSRAR